jgi:hypothetical protein
VPDGSWQLAGIDSCRWKEDPCLPETEEVILVQMFLESTDHDAAMYAKELCDFMKRLVLATPSEANMHKLTGEVRAFKDTKEEDNECRAKVFERHANELVE